MPADQLSYEDVQRMRQIVQQFDAQRKPMQTIDLNNPPKEPYRFQKFPKLVYGPAGQTLTVGSEEHLQDALADGWSEEPIPVETQAPELSAAYQREVEQHEQRLVEARRKRKAEAA